MPRLATPRPVKSVLGRTSKRNPVARALTPFPTDAIAHDASSRSGRGALVALARGNTKGHTRVAVASNLHDVMGLQAFTQPPQAATNLEADDALLLPFV